MARARVSGLLVLYVSLVLLDAFLGFALYKQLITASARVVGVATGEPRAYAAVTTRRAFLSKELWMLVSAGVAALAAKAVYDVV
jgi:hypothetical protein